MISDYLALADKLDEAKRQLKELNQQKRDMEANIFSMLAAEGAGKISVHGVTVAPRRQMRARSSNMPMLIEALKAEGLDPLVAETVNANTLTGWVNQFDPDRMCSADELLERLPEGVREHVGLYEQNTLSVTRS